MLIAGRLDHVAIAAEDTGAMVEWYGRVLGLVVHAEVSNPAPEVHKTYLIGPPAPRDHAWKGVGQGMMMEIMPRNTTPRHERNSHEPGISHVAWYVADFDAAFAHLKDCGVQLLGEVVQAVGGGRILSFLDCEGNMMQIVERR